MRRAMRSRRLPSSRAPAMQRARRSPRRRSSRRPRARRGRRLRCGALQQAVVLRDVGERRQEQRIRQVVERREDDALQVHRARDQDQPRQRDARALTACRPWPRRASCRSSRRQIDAASSSACGASARARITSVSAATSPSTESIFLRASALRRRRPAGVRRIDEDEVEVLEPAVRVVDDGERRRRHAAVVGRRGRASGRARRGAARSTPSPGRR